jgi:hypothetical protein
MRSKALFFAAIVSAAVVLMAAAPGAEKKAASLPKNRSLPDGWTKPVDICPNLQYWSYDSRLATDASGFKVFAIWIEEGGGAKRIYFNTNERGGWETPQALHPPFVIGEYPGPKIALDVNGDAVVSFQARMPSGNYEIIHRKRVYGEWNEPENASRTENGGSMPGGITVDPKTNDYYICFQDDFARPTEDAVYWGVYLVRKSGEGGPWGPAVRIPDVTNRSYFPDARITANGNGYIIWDNRSTFAGSYVFFSENKTLLDPLGWTPPIDVSGNTGTVDNFGFSYPRLAVDDDDNIYVSWLQNIGNWETFFRKRVKGKWQGRENISQTETKSSHSTVAANQKTGEIYVAWSEDTLEGVYIYMRIFTNKNAQKVWKWGETINMTPDSQTSDYPTLFADALGGIHLAYTSNKNGPYHIWYTAKLGDVAGLPPLDVVATSAATAADPRKKDTTVAWANNPVNDAIVLESYRVYRKKKDDPDTAYALAGTVDDQVFQFMDANLLGVQVYTYKVSSVAEGQLESVGSTPADDQFVPPPFFPPTNLAVASVLGGDILKKDNTLTWKKDGRNRPSELAGYRIYRKRAEEDDAAYVLAGEAAPSVFSLTDAGLVHDQAYTYAAASHSVYDHESERGAPVTDLKVFATTYPPSAPVLSTRLHASSGTKLNVLTWQANPLNEGLPIQSTRIYRAEGEAGSFEDIGKVGVDVRIFEDRGLPTGIKYAYQLASVPVWEIESERAAVLTEDPVFPPVNILLETRSNSYLLHREKVNRLTWARSPLNETVTVAGYKIYRKGSTEDDAAFAPVGTVAGTVFEYFDRKLPFSLKFVYRITAIDSSGRESRASADLVEI